MHLRENSGQAVILSVMLLGAIMALTIVFGNKRQVDLTDFVAEMSEAQQATEALTAAAQRVQRMYTAESGCDPGILDSRLSRLGPLPGNPDLLGLAAPGKVSYAVAQYRQLKHRKAPYNLGDLTKEQRENRCTAGAGCRQLAVPLERRVFIVTVGEIEADDPDPSGKDCPRDATVRLSVAVNGDLFYRRVTLLNLCTLKSCPTTTTAYSFSGISGDVTGWATTSACGSMPARTYGSIVSAAGSSNVISVEDLRWARRYLDTGGGAVGDTTYANDSSITQNIACTPAVSVNQCSPIACVPPFDLNRDKTNNDADLAILEFYLRGFIPRLPVMELTN